MHAPASIGEEAIVDLVEYDENFDIDRATPKPVGWPIRWLKDEDDGWRVSYFLIFFIRLIEA